MVNLDTQMFGSELMRPIGVQLSESTKLPALFGTSE
jgi:hypothetical protein